MYLHVRIVKVKGLGTCSTLARRWYGLGYPYAHGRPSDTCTCMFASICVLPSLPSSASPSTFLLGSFVLSSSLWWCMVPSLCSTLLCSVTGEGDRVRVTGFGGERVTACGVGG